MTRRRLLVFGLLAALLAMGVGVWLLWPAEPRPSAITHENAAKIRVGMTMAEVEAILGGPRRSEASGKTAEDLTGPAMEVAPIKNSKIKHVVGVTWCSDTAHVIVDIDEEERVVAFTIWAVRRTQESPIEIVRRLLHL